MPVMRVNKKNQVTIPASVRKELNMQIICFPMASFLINFVFCCLYLVVQTMRQGNVLYQEGTSYLPKILHLILSL